MINMGAVGGVGGQNLRDVEVQAGSVPKHIDQGRKACVARGRQERQGREEAMAVGVDGHVRAWIAKVSGNALCINQNPQCGQETRDIGSKSSGLQLGFTRFINSTHSS